MRDRSHPIEGRRAELGADRGEDVLRLVAGVGPDHAAHLLVPQVLREGRRRRHGQEGEEAVEVSGAVTMNSRYQRNTSPARSSGQSIGPA